MLYSKHSLSFKLRPKQEEAVMNILYQRKTLCCFPTGFGKSVMSLPRLITRISRLVTDARPETLEMLCESCSQMIAKFHQNGIVLIISHLKALMDNHIEEAERLNLDAFKAKDPQRGIQETRRGPICHLFAWSNAEGNIYLSSSTCIVEGHHNFNILNF